VEKNMTERKFETGALEAEQQAQTTKPLDGQLTRKGAETMFKVLELAAKVGAIGEDGLFHSGVGVGELVGPKGEINLEALREAGGEELVRRVTDWVCSRPESSAPWSARTEQANRKGPQGRFSNNGRGEKKRGPGRYSSR
jgi:hypothetical protein